MLQSWWTGFRVHLSSHLDRGTHLCIAGHMKKNRASDVGECKESVTEGHIEQNAPRGAREAFLTSAL